MLNIPYVPAGAPLMLAMAIMFQYGRDSNEAPAALQPAT